MFSLEENEMGKRLAQEPILEDDVIEGQDELEKEIAALEAGQNEPDYFYSDDDEEEVEEKEAKKAQDTIDDFFANDDEDDDDIMAEFNEVEDMISMAEEKDEEMPVAKKSSEVQPGIEDEIHDPFSETKSEFPEFDYSEGEDWEGDVINTSGPIEPDKTISPSLNAKVARMKEAVRRLDRVAAYLESKGQKKVAFRVDSISDVIEQNIARLSK